LFVWRTYEAVRAERTGQTRREGKKCKSRFDSQRSPLLAGDLLTVDSSFSHAKPSLHAANLILSFQLDAEFDDKNKQTLLLLHLLLCVTGKAEVTSTFADVIHLD
jgi:hypothetical protein